MISGKNKLSVLLLRFDQIPNIKLKMTSSSAFIKFKLRREKFILKKRNWKKIQMACLSRIRFLFVGRIPYIELL